MLLATGFLSYSGPFNQEFRNLMLKTWRKEMTSKKIPFTDDLDIIKMLVDNATIAEWNLEGLPNDELSIQNGLIVTKASRWDNSKYSEEFLISRHGAKMFLSADTHC